MDIDNLLISQDYTSNKSAVEVITQIVIRKPRKVEYVRVKPEKEFSCGPVAIYEDRENRCTYIVSPKIIQFLDGYYQPANLTTAISKSGELFLWPLKLPKKDGRDNQWFQSARAAAEMAKNNWINVKADHTMKMYKVKKAEGDIPEPEWPTISFDKIMKKVSSFYLIDNENHLVIQRLRGLI